MHIDALSILRDLVRENDKHGGVPRSSPTWKLARELVDKTQPALSIQIGLVPYGYEIDVTNHSRPKAVSQSFSCRDFGGSYNVPLLADVISEVLIEAMKEVEPVVEKISKLRKRKSHELRQKNHKSKRKN
jgi:hypothetical protein